MTCSTTGTRCRYPPAAGANAPVMFTPSCPGNTPAVRNKRSGRGGPLFDAVLFDRDGTLIEDVPFNGDPARVRPMPGAREALEPAPGRRACGSWSGDQPVRGGRVALIDLGQAVGSTRGWRSCSARSTPGRCVRTTTVDGCRLPQTSAPGLVYAAAALRGTTRPNGASSSATSARDMTAAGAGGRRGGPRADSGHPPRGDRRGAHDRGGPARRGAPDSAASAAGRPRRARRPSSPAVRVGGPSRLRRRCAAHRAGDPRGGRQRRAGGDALRAPRARRRRAAARRRPADRVAVAVDRS